MKQSVTKPPSGLADLFRIDLNAAMVVCPDAVVGAP
jgi:hypothetical protein